MALCQRMSKSRGKVFFIDQNCFPQTIAVLETRAEPVGVELVIGDPAEAENHDCFGVLLQYPGADGAVSDFSDVIEKAHEKKALVVMAADILSLMLLKSPGELGAGCCGGFYPALWCSSGFLVAPMRAIWQRAKVTSVHCRVVWWECPKTVGANLLTGWRCKPASSIFAAKRPPATFVPRRSC